MMKESGILFGAPMVMAILREENPKRMTRRGAAFKPLAEGLNLGFTGLVANEVRPGWWVLSSRGAGGCWEERTEQLRCPYGQIGDRLYVREAWRSEAGLDALSGSEMADRCIDAGYRLPWAPIQYEADGDRRDWQHVGTPPHDGPPRPGRYRHARFMPRWASRILLEIVRVRVERLQAISEVDAIAEGIGKTSSGLWSTYGQRSSDGTPSARASFHALWDSINGPADWAKNPWVWVVEFKPVTASQEGHDAHH
ncbi:Phage-related protein [plant metagenome]|uniref:Phage-related protein n=1 Tax=plant metagenome TaxID=1297885 RepID=A0A484U4F9_9ZZZZ